MVKQLLVILTLFGVFNAQAQFATARLSKSKVVLEEPIKVIITAYSPTWFAEPLTFSNLQINGAFIQSFSRTIPSIKTINNKKYATLTFYYIIFPYQEGELVFPELTLTTSIPPEGDFKGQPVSLKTKAIKIQVQAIPKNADADHWLVASNVTIKNHWSTDLEKVKVGDVIKRSITIYAKGTLPSFIDEPVIGEADFASIYTSEPEFIDARDDNNSNGKRIDTYSYLVEETGEYSIPEVVVKWWNPYVSKYYSRKLPAYKINVSENPDLLSLALLKDSLNAINQPMMMAESEEDSGADYKLWIITGFKVIIFIALALIILRLFKKLMGYFQRKRIRYLASESYWFHQILKQKKGKGLLNSLYQWLDRTSIELETNTLAAISNEDKDLEPEFNKLQQELFSSVNKTGFDTNKIKRELSKWRKGKKITRNKIDLPELN